MARLKVGPRPSEEIVSQANEVTYVVDARGRKIGLKSPTLLAQFRLVELLGESAKNQTFMGMVLPIVMVCEIDGHAVHPPSTRAQLDALISRVDNDGLAAIAAHLGADMTEEPEDDPLDKVKKS